MSEQPMSDQPARHADTPALRDLVERGIPHEVVRTERSSSIEEAAARRGIPVGALLKTLVVRRGDNDYLFVLVPGDRAIDWSKLRSHLDIRRISLPDAAEARAATGYERGAITPFGATNPWPVIVDSSIEPGSTVSLGGGDHGVSVKLRVDDVVSALGAVHASVTKPIQPRAHLTSGPSDLRPI